ncbi:MAG: hypothetical protein E7019_01910 [Alphaproteobacteria bacterium]|nr:hypothetical protein [Alphaproteobacteria bacterium]
MVTLLCISLVLNVGLLAFIAYNWQKQRQTTKSSSTHKTENKTVKETNQTSVQSSAPLTMWNEHLRDLATSCEEKLLPEDRGLIKILIEREYPDFPAILKVGNIMLSIKREESNVSQFEVITPREALVLARDGYNGTARYLLTPDELKFVLKHYEAINVYLEALGLETIDPSNQFWCINTTTNWTTGWKRFDYDIEVAFNHFKNRFMTISQHSMMYRAMRVKGKLILKLSGWEHLFCEA